MRLVKELGDVNACITLPVSFMQGGAYAEIDELRLLIDSGSATTIVSAAAASARQLGAPGHRATLSSQGLSLSCSVASPLQALPPGVDGILGVDSLKGYQAVELDWAAPELRLHTAPLTDDSEEIASMPLFFRRVAGGELPFVRASFEGGSCSELDGLVDTGSPVTMITPELASEAALDLGALAEDADIITTGVDGQPTRMRATLCRAIALGDPMADEPTINHAGATVYTGKCPMMAKVGWEGSPAALLGLDVLRMNAATSGRLVLDFGRGRLKCLK